MEDEILAIIVSGHSSLDRKRIPLGLSKKEILFYYNPRGVCIYIYTHKPMIAMKMGIALEK